MATENRSIPHTSPTAQGGSGSGGLARSPGRIRWLIDPEPETLERALGLLSALSEPGEGASGRVTPIGWEQERTDPAHRVFLQRSGAHWLRVAWFAPSMSLTRGEGLRFFRTPVERHLRRLEEAEELGLPVAPTVGAGIVQSPRPLVSAPRSLLMTLWPPEARPIHQWLRGAGVAKDDRVELARSVAAIAHVCHWRNLIGLEFEAHALFVDPKRRRLIVPDLHALRAGGPLLGPARAAADRAAVDRLCGRILAGTRVSVADVHKRAA